MSFVNYMYFAIDSHEAINRSEQYFLYTLCPYDNPFTTHKENTNLDHKEMSRIRDTFTNQNVLEYIEA